MRTKLINHCIIPARGGSKRIPRKNIKPFMGKPIIAWSIEAAIKSKCFENVYVSTDDEEIGEVARRYGAKIPFVRPSTLSDDYTGTKEVMKHAIDTLTRLGASRDEDNFCCLYATAPLINESDLRNAMNISATIDSDCMIYTGTRYTFPIQRSVLIDAKGYTEALFPKEIEKRSQDLPTTYHDAGQFYWAGGKTWKNNTSIIEKGRIIVLPKWRVQDIDTIEDWKRAELMYKAINEK